jgi:hypothetical protein
MEQLTFWRKPPKGREDSWEESQFAAATLRFAPHGIVLRLTRDTETAVKPRWIVTGSHGVENGRRWILLHNAPDTLDGWAQNETIGAELSKLGWIVIDTPIRDIRTTSQETTRETNPLSLMGCKRKRSSVLGEPTSNERGAYSFGGRFNTNQHQMHLAILARRQQRKQGSR